MEQQDTKEDDYSITVQGLILMEKASRLMIRTPFEDKVLADRTHAVRQFGLKARFTEKQLEVIRGMAIRYNAIRNDSVMEAAVSAALGDAADRVAGEIGMG